MRKLIFRTLVIFALVSFSCKSIKAQESVDSTNTSTEQIWHHADLADDEIVGISLEKANNFLKKTGRKPKKMLVAIIDSGIDTAHVDLKDNLWKNPGEIPGNGIDDDGNGYIDDVFGWNFLGNNKGENVNGDTWELTRFYSILKKKYDNKSKKEIEKNQKEEYNIWLEVKQKYEAEKKQKQDEVDFLDQMVKTFDIVIEILTEEFQKSDFSIEEVFSLETTDEKLAEAKKVYLSFAMRGMERDDLASYLKNSKSELDSKLNPLFNARELIGDQLDSMEDSIYGNNDVMAETSGHGTSVAGVVGAVIYNNIGVRGIADNVELMAVRVVPGGDERDKDVAMGIRYAVNNGAQIINGSFGKDYSPNKKFVDDAVRYAESKNVLIVHAAGNDGKNNDLGGNFPNAIFIENGQKAKNWIEVGASSQYITESLAANFSNYGQKSVDIFAPGVNISSTSPGSNYGKSSGTSLASPVVAGVAALVWSYYPELTAQELKKIIEDSSVRFPGLKVQIVNAKSKHVMVKFEKISQTGGIVNAYEAVRLADKFVKNKK